VRQTPYTTVYEGLHGQRPAAIKVVDPHGWEPEDSYRWEAQMYSQLPELQQAGIIPTMFGHGYLDTAVPQYYTAMSIAPGVPLSTLKRPYPGEVRR